MADSSKKKKVMLISRYTNPALIILAEVAVGWGLLSGCTHINNAADAKVADAAVTQTQALADAQNKTFDTIDANNQAASDTMIDFLNKDAVKSGYGPLAYKKTTWKQIKDEIGEPGVTDSSLLAPFTEQVKSLAGDMSEMSEAEREMKSTADTVTAANKALSAAKDAQVEWDKQTAFWSKLIETLPTADQETAKDQNLKTTLTNLKSQADKAEFTYTDVDGKAKTMSLGDEAVAQLKTLASTHPEGTLLTAPPGLTLQMAALAKDLASAEAQRATALLHKLEAEKPLLDDAIQYEAFARAELKELQDTLADVKPQDNEICTQTIVQGMAQDASVAKTRMLYGVLLNRGFVDYLTKQVFILKVRGLLLQKQYNDTETRINVSERQALISRGVESLQIYHDGGVKPEQIAQLVYAIAQTGVLSAIALK